MGILPNENESLYYLKETLLADRRYIAKIFKSDLKDNYPNLYSYYKLLYSQYFLELSIKNDDPIKQKYFWRQADKYCDKHLRYSKDEPNSGFFKKLENKINAMIIYGIECFSEANSKIHLV